MSIDDWSDLLPQTIYHAELAGRDDYGKPSYGSAVAYSARVVFKDGFIQAKDGSQIQFKGMVWIQGVPDISTEDQLTLPDSTSPPIVTVERFPDENGLHHTKVYFGI